mmetsp:Transcript_16093/g.27179  ORF Transcript_16093/g.27179 Transcript_16093/m.27179 type:complete len:207 (+) Transcript_16093:286-906(+)
MEVEGLTRSDGSLLNDVVVERGHRVVPIHPALLVEARHHQVLLLLLYIALETVIGGALLAGLAGRGAIVVLKEVLGALGGPTVLHRGRVLERLAHHLGRRVLVGRHGVLLLQHFVLSLLRGVDDRLPVGALEGLPHQVRLGAESVVRVVGPSRVLPQLVHEGLLVGGHRLLWIETSVRLDDVGVSTAAIGHVGDMFRGDVAEGSIR